MCLCIHMPCIHPPLSLMLCVEDAVGGGEAAGARRPGGGLWGASARPLPGAAGPAAGEGGGRGPARAAAGGAGMGPEDLLWRAPERAMLMPDWLWNWGPIPYFYLLYCGLLCYLPLVTELRGASSMVVSSHGVTRGSCCTLPLWNGRALQDLSTSAVVVDGRLRKHIVVPDIKNLTMLSSALVISVRWAVGIICGFQQQIIKYLKLASKESDSVFSIFCCQQKQIRLQDSKTVEEKAAKIKEWVMLKLSDVNIPFTMLLWWFGWSLNP